MRRPALLAGLLVLAMIWLGPLLSVWRDSFAAQMLAHMGVVAIAAPLIAIGLPERWRPGPGMPATLPVLASVVELLAVWSWHAPAARAAAEASLAVTVVEQAMFLTAGVFLWWTSFTAPEERGHAAAGAGALLLTSIHMTLIGALLALSPRSLYGTGDVSCFGTVLGSEEDQQIGGVIMLAIGAMVYLAGGLALVSKTLAGPWRIGSASVGPGEESPAIG